MHANANELNSKRHNIVIQKSKFVSDKLRDREGVGMRSGAAKRAITALTMLCNMFDFHPTPAARCNRTWTENSAISKNYISSNCKLFSVAGCVNLFFMRGYFRLKNLQLNWSYKSYWYSFVFTIFIRYLHGVWNGVFCHNPFCLNTQMTCLSLRKITILNCNHLLL